jgi:hypothetical protein
MNESTVNYPPDLPDEQRPLYDEWRDGLSVMPWREFYIRRLITDGRFWAIVQGMDR